MFVAYIYIWAVGRGARWPSLEESHTTHENIMREKLAQAIGF